MSPYTLPHLSKNMILLAYAVLELTPYCREVHLTTGTVAE